MTPPTQYIKHHFCNYETQSIRSNLYIEIVATNSAGS